MRLARRGLRVSGVCSLAAALTLLMAGCGVPGEPLPPLLELPEPAHDLVAEQVGSRVILRFTRPQLTTEATLIRYLDRIEIHRADLAPNASAESFSEQEKLLANLPAAQLPAGAGQLSYELPLEGSQRGAKAVFGVKAINHREQDAGYSNLAAIEIADLPEPPADLRGTLSEPAIELHWTPAERSVFGGPAPNPDGYEVYRADSATPALPQLLVATSATSYQDQTFAFGTSYIYTVRAVVHGGDSTARTPESNRVEIAAIDRFPPAAPQNLRAIAVPGAVELAWSPNTEPDLAGYTLYRSDGGAFVRLNSELLLLPLYRDSTTRAGGEYRYVVKATDRAGNEGPASEEAPADAE